jgi:hypothetical protein
MTSTLGHTSGYLMLAIGMLCAPLFSLAQVVVNVVPTPSNIVVDEGETFSLTLMLEPINGAQVTVGDIAMSFDPALLQVNTLALAPGTLLPFAIAPQSIDNVAGTFFIGGFNFMPVSASFDHVVVEFQALAQGTTTIEHILDGSLATSIAFSGNFVTGSTQSIPVQILGEPVVDCAGVTGGTAFFDECGECVGGSTSLGPCAADCEGLFGGSALPGSACLDENDQTGNYDENCACIATPACTANGGTLEAPPNRSYCVGTGTPVGINISAVGASGTNQRWALIDSDGNIVETKAGNSLFNLDARSPGNYSIRYIRYENDVTNLGDIGNISQASSLVGCYALASNAINLFLRNEPQAGMLSAITPTSVCANAGAATSIQVSISGNTGEFGRFGITSVALSQQVISTNASGSFNLNGLPPGSYNVGHLSYQQGVNIAGIAFPSQLVGCFDLSNFISVTILDCVSAK